MKITILPQGTLAIYEQIVNQLKNAVVTGELKAGEALPSIRALAADLGVSVITTKRAYEELEKEGLVRSVAGKGFYVCEYNADYLKEKQLVLLEKRLNEVIEEAKQAKVPVHKDSKLADTLSRLEIGELIPPELYEVVAEILVFVDQMDRIRAKMEQANKKK